MRWIDATLMTCMALAACISLYDGAHGLQSDAQFWMVIELGNIFLIEYPPPGFDSDPFLNVHSLDTALSLTVGSAPGVKPMATFGEAGTITQLPECDPGCEWMHTTIVLDWEVKTDSRSLYTNVSASDLKQWGSKPYLGPVRVHTTVDLREWCNTVGKYGVTCVNDYSSRNMTTAYSRGYGDILRLPSVGRAIIDVKWTQNATDPVWDSTKWPEIMLLIYGMLWVSERIITQLSQLQQIYKGGSPAPPWPEPRTKSGGGWTTGVRGPCCPCWCCLATRRRQQSCSGGCCGQTASTARRTIPPWPESRIRRNQGPAKGERSPQDALGRVHPGR